MKAIDPSLEVSMDRKPSEPCVQCLGFTEPLSTWSALIQVLEGRLGPYLQIQPGLWPWGGRFLGQALWSAKFQVWWPPKTPLLSAWPSTQCQGMLGVQGDGVL